MMVILFSQTNYNISCTSTQTAKINETLHYWGSRGLMDRALDLKPKVTQGCGFESWLWQEVSTIEVRPLSKAPNPQLLPAAVSAAHRSTWMG